VFDDGLLITKPIRAHFCIRNATWGELAASENLVLMYQSRRRYIPEDGVFRLHHFVTMDCTGTRTIMNLKNPKNNKVIDARHLCDHCCSLRKRRKGTVRMSNS